MSRKVPGPPKGQPWVWIPREVLRSPAWRKLGINARRLIDFLLIEHMNHGGKENGFLLAPRNQLEAFGIGRRHITGAIEKALAAKLIDVKPGIGRRPSTFTLRWLPVAVHEGELQGCTKVNNKARSSARTCAATAQNKGSRRCTPYRSSYHDRSYITDVYSDDAQAPVTDLATQLNGKSLHPSGKSQPPRHRQAPITPRGAA
jgi:hypothetical protein